ncbi:hypothetical protein DOY81_015072, partial [Sarcophaga bullata]
PVWLDGLDIGDFLLLHLLGQNVNTKSYNEMIQELCNLLGSSRTPSAPSTLEMNPMNPIYPQVDSYGKEAFGKETET